MALDPHPVDISILPMDQHSPVTEGPTGRIVDLVNAQIRQYQDAQDGTHLQVSKRNGFLTASSNVRNADGTSAGVLPVDDYQCLWNDGKTDYLIAHNRLYQHSGDWIETSSPVNGNSIVFPQTLRQDVTYAADSQVTAPDFARIGNNSCSVWVENSRTLSDNSASNPDWFASGTPTALNGCRALFRDEDSKSYFRAPFTVVQSTETYAFIKVVTDGTYFYVFQHVNAPSVAIRITIFSSIGEQLDTTVISTNTKFWDVTFLSGFPGILLAQPNGASNGVTFSTISWAPTTFTIHSHSDTTVKCNSNIVAWLTNDFTTNLAYLASVTDDTTHYSLYAYRVTTGLVQDHEYPVVASGGILNVSGASARIISGITGYVHSGVNPDVTVAYTVEDFFGKQEKVLYGAGNNSKQNDEASDNFPDQSQTRTISVFVPYAGSASRIATRFFQSLVSRAFNLNGDYVSVCYYASRKWGPLSDPALQKSPFDPTNGTPHFPFRVTSGRDFQPTWYLAPLDSPQPIAGRWEYGQASADWQIVYPDSATSGSPNFTIYDTNRMLVSPAQIVSGAWALPLPYRQEELGVSFAREVKAVPIPTAQLIQAFPGQAPSVQQTTSTASVSNLPSATIGLKEFYIGPDCGQVVVERGVSHIPGLLSATLDTGEYAEHGISAPEAPWIASDTMNSSEATAAEDGPYIYVGVSEVVTRSGLIYRSLVSPAFSYTFAFSADDQQNAVFTNSVNPTLHEFARLSFYRTGIRDATPSQAFYKITSDLEPFYNDFTGSGVLTNTQEFLDKLGLNTQQTGEILYQSQGELPHFPMPANRGGCIWQNRLVVIGYDNALWISGDIQEGQGTWFNPGLRTAPLDDEITKIVVMDNSLLVLCANSVRYLPAGTQLPDNTGSNGTIPRPFELPFQMGCTGFAVATRLGVFYYSSTNSVWLVTRQFTNVWIGENAITDLTGTCGGIAVDGNNRVVINMGGYFSVYDLTSTTWGKWTTVDPPSLVAMSSGQTMYASNGRVWIMNPAIYYDRDTVPMSPVNNHIEMLLEAARIHVGNVRGWKRTWAFQVEGSVATDCYLNISLEYSDFDTTPSSFFQTQAFTGGLEYEFNPQIDDTPGFGIVLWDSITGTAGDGRTFDPGQGLVIDIFACSLGMESGLKKMPAAKRIPGSITT